MGLTAVCFCVTLGKRINLSVHTHFKSIVLGSGMNWEIGIDTYTLLILCIWASLRGSDGKESACNAGDRG